MNEIDAEIDEDLERIAVVGMGGRFPGARNISEFWENLREGRDGIRDFSDAELKAAGVDSDLLENPNYVKRGAFLEGADKFDSGFFGLTPREAEFMDPQHRVFLECAWETLENGGYDSQNYEGLIGVFAGAGLNNYILKNLMANPELLESVGDYQLMIGNDKDYLASKVAYKLDLRGPAINVQSACSTSLVAVQLACQSLLTYQCDMALAGGVSVMVPRGQGYLYQEGFILSPDGYCRAFDEKSKGTVQGEGVGAVLLKRLSEALEDGDTIHAIISGAAVNNDGALKAGFTAPAVEGQAGVIAMAQEMAEISPESISYIETHGTGTPLGDPIEIAALTKAFRAKTEKIAYCALGSVKTNIGHLDAAAGMAGFIKTVLALKHKQIPQNLNFENANSKLNLENSPFYVNSEFREWPEGETPRRAGVSSFGIGGTNAHVILEEAPVLKESGPSRTWQTLTFSAKSKTALDRKLEEFADYVRLNPDLNLADAAYSLRKGRRDFDYRASLVCRTFPEGTSALGSGDPKYILKTDEATIKQPVAYVLPDFDVSYLKSCSVLYGKEANFQETVDFCAEFLRPTLGEDLRDILFPRHYSLERAAEFLARDSFSSPALFIVQYALAKLWMDWGLQPAAMLGRGVGEYVAACLAGVFSLEDGLSLITARGRLLEAKGESSDNPDFFEIKNLLREMKLSNPGIPLVSVDRNTWISSKDAKDSDYWAEKAGKLTDFYLGVKTLLKDSYYVFLEIGPGNVLSSLPEDIMQEEGDSPVCTVIPTLSMAKDENRVMETIARAMGNLWILGTEWNWETVFKDQHRKRIELPTYPFEGKRYWIDARKQPAKTPETPDNPIESIEERVTAVWTDLLGYDDIEADDNFFELAGDSLKATQLINRLNKRLGLSLTLIDFFHDPTVAGLSRRINGQRKETEGKGSEGGLEGYLPVLFPMQPNGSQTPLFMVAGAHEVDPMATKSTYEEDFLLYLSSIIPHIGMDQPIYGIRPKGLLPNEIPHKTVEEMATAYIEEIQKFQPNGPYLLAGECIGGIVAFEMAQQLKEMGHEVGHLLMMDTHFTSPKFAVSERYLYHRRRVVTIFRKLNQDLKSQGVPYMLKELLKFWRETLPITFPLTPKRWVQRKLIRRSYKYLKTLLAYRPEPYAGDVTLIINERWYNREPNMGWEDRISEHFNIIKTSGTHTTRLTTYGKVTGKHLRDAINRGLQKYSPPEARQKKPALK